MVIDSIMGAIDLTASESGLRYGIGFVQAGTTDTWMQILTSLQFVGHFPAAAMAVRLGIIDLKKSLNDMFGAHPVDGQTAGVNIFYRLNDGSNMALQHIVLEVIYYQMCRI